MTLRILYLDDEHRNLERYPQEVMVLAKKRRMALKIDTAHGMGEAFEKMKATAYDCIITDYDLNRTDPNMNGLDFAREARAQGYDKPMILFTSSARQSVRDMHPGAMSELKLEYCPKGTSYPRGADSLLQTLDFVLTPPGRARA